MPASGLAVTLAVTRAACSGHSASVPVGPTLNRRGGTASQPTRRFDPAPPAQNRKLRIPSGVWRRGPLDLEADTDALYDWLLRKGRHVGPLGLA